MSNFKEKPWMRDRAATQKGYLNLHFESDHLSEKHKCSMFDYFNTTIIDFTLIWKYFLCITCYKELFDVSVQ